MTAALFLGHGSPMHAIEPNRFAASWRELGLALERPAGVVCVSAHWYRAGAAVTAMAAPRTIHDFYGFPQELYDVRYPAPGSPALAERVAELLAPVPVELDHTWGLDHGTWSVLLHLLPAADVPVVQLAVDATERPGHHLEVGRRLAALREEGVLVLGSGNVVHNLGALLPAEGAPPYEWASAFDEFVRGALDERDDLALVEYLGHPAARLAAPTPEHYLPLLYVLGAAGADEAATTVVDGLVAGSLSMRSVRFG